MPSLTPTDRTTRSWRHTGGGKVKGRETTNKFIFLFLPLTSELEIDLVRPVSTPLEPLSSRPSHAVVPTLFALLFRPSFILKSYQDALQDF